MKTKGVLFVVLLFLMVTNLPLNVSKAGTTWTYETVTQTGTVGVDSSLALDSSGNPHMSYRDATNGDLKYICMSGGEWNAPVTVDSTGTVGGYSSLALDSNGNPHISYHDWTNEGLKYIRMSGGEWNAPVTLDSTGELGGYSSLALDSNDNPHISYYEYLINYGKLKYICMSGGVWNAPVTVDSTGAVGGYNSLALDSAGNPHISYYDWTNWDLKYAALKEALTVGNVQTWFWTDHTSVNSVVRGDVDGDGKQEIVTGGSFFDGARDVAQLCVWDGDSLAFEGVATWYWTDDTSISSVAVGDVDGDGQVEIVTGGTFNDGFNTAAQLCVWDGATLALENVKTWSWPARYWPRSTVINSVGVGDVDGDGKMEVVTGGRYFSAGSSYFAELCVWDGATLALENAKTWSWTVYTYMWSVGVGDVDGDGEIEIVTGGHYYDYTGYVAQLCVWDGATLALENIKTWYWTGDTYIWSVGVGDVDGDGQAEVVTGGSFYDGSRNVAQLCVWSGASLALEDVQTWYWTGDTEISSVGVGDVDGDGGVEVVTGGWFWDGSRDVAQLCVWSGDSLALEDIQSWFWADGSWIRSVVVGDVDGDVQAEIVTGGGYGDGSRDVAQLCVWEY